MRITSSFTNSRGETLRIDYCEDNPLLNLNGATLQGVHAFCFYANKMVLVNHPKSGWMPPGGGIEPGETYEEAVVCEVKEETNMRVTYQKFIGFVDIYESDNKITRQVRSFCIVEPIGPFVADPDGEIKEITLINPTEYKKYFDWGEGGDYIMKRAMELSTVLEKISDTSKK